VGRLSDRLGARAVMTLSMVVLGLMTMGLALATRYDVMLVVRLVSGIGVSGMFVAGGHYVTASWHGRHVFLAHGLYGGSVQLGMGLAIFLLPVVAEAAGWRMALALSAVPVAVAVVVWLGTAVQHTAPGARGRIRDVIGDATVWRLGLANAAMFGLSVILGTWVAVYFVHEFRLPLAGAGMLGSLAVILGLAGRTLGGVLMARGTVEPRPLILATLLGNTGGMAVMAYPGRPLGVAVVAAVLLGLSASLSYAAVITLAARAQPRATGAALGLMGTTSTAAVVVGAPLAGALFSVAGTFTLPFLVLALLPAGGFVACLALPRR
jgi:MFS transporter, CP family, cyanate transporter